MSAQFSLTIRLVVFAILVFGLDAAALKIVFRPSNCFAQSDEPVEEKPASEPDVAEDEKKEPSDDKTNTRRIMELLKPDGVFLIDENGDRIYVPTDSYESFQKYLNSKTSTGSQSLGQYIIEKNDVQITVDGGFARVEMDLNARVLGSEDATYRIPISLSQFAITEVPIATPVDSGFLRVVEPTVNESSTTETGLIQSKPRSNGALSYQWVIRYKSDAPVYKLKIVGVVPVVDTGKRQTIEMELPPATTRIRLNLPRNDLRVELNSGFGEVMSTTDEQSKTIALIATTGGQFGLTWASQESDSTPELITANSATRYAFDAIQNRWSGSVAIQLDSAKSLAGQEFEITLPENCTVTDQSLSQIQSESGQRYQLSVLETETPSARNLLLRYSPSINDRRSTVEFSFAVNSTNVNRQEFGSITISEIQEHFGTIGFSIPEGRQFRWTESQGLRIKRVSKDTAGANETVFDFEFDNQQFRLNTLLLNTEEEQKTIRTSYVVTIDKNRAAVLRGVVEFPSSFQLVTNLRINPRGWEVKNLTPFPSNETEINFLVDERGIVTPDTYSLLSASGANSPLGTNGNVRAMAINCELPWPISTASSDESQSTTLDFQLPTFSYESRLESVVESQGDGVLALSIDKTILAIPNAGQIKGLKPDSSEVAILDSMLQSSSNMPDNQYRFSSNDDKPRWSGTLEKRQVEALSVNTTKIDITDSSYRSVQNWSLTIRNGKIDKLLFLVPEALVANARSSLPFTFSISINGEPTPWRVAAKKPADLPEDAATQVIQLLCEPQDGRVEIESQIVVSLPELASANDTTENVLETDIFYIHPLLDVTQIENGVMISVENSIDCEISSDLLTGKVADEESMKFALVVPPNQCTIPVAIGVPENPVKRSVNLERIWIETTVGRYQRRDRLVGVVNSETNTLRINFPDYRELKQIQFLVDGVEVLPPFSPDKAEYDIAIPKSSSLVDAPPEKSVVEILVWSEISTGFVNSLRPVLPLFNGTSPECSFAWELNLPSSSLLVSHNEELVSQFKWRWSLAGLSRTLTGDADSMSSWLGVPIRPTEGRPHDRYLFNGIASAEAASVTILPAYLIWLPTALSVLFAAAVWCFVPKARNPFWLLLIAGMAFTISFFSVDLAILVVQSATFALAILLLVWCVHLAVRGQTRKRSVFASVGNSTRQRSASTINTPADSQAGSHAGSLPGSGSTATERRI